MLHGKLHANSIQTGRIAIPSQVQQRSRHAMSAIMQVQPTHAFKQHATCKHMPIYQATKHASAASPCQQRCKHANLTRPCRQPCKHASCNSDTAMPSCNQAIKQACKCNQSMPTTMQTCKHAIFYQGHAINHASMQLMQGHAINHAGNRASMQVQSCSPCQQPCKHANLASPCHQPCNLPSLGAMYINI